MPTSSGRGRAADVDDACELIGAGRMLVRRTEADRGRGIVVDPDIGASGLAEVIAAFAERGATIMGVMASVITDSDGDGELVLHVRAPGGEGAAPRRDDRFETLIDAAVRGAATR